MTMSQEKEVADRIADWNIANEFRLGQVQGFGYGADGLHLVIRDCWLKPNEQTVWERHATLETHATDHAEMMRQIEVYRLALALRETAALRTAREEGYRQGVGDAAKVSTDYAAKMSEVIARREESGKPTFVAECKEDAGQSIASAILALTPSSALADPGRQGVGARVKPLVWARAVGTETMSRAETLLGTYRVWTPHDAGSWFVSLSIPGAGQEWCELVVDEEAAKAAAQRDYEQRIMSALAEPGDGWLSMDSAPRDGKIIIVPGGIAHWYDGAWHTLTGYDWPGRPIQYPVQRWMPLPSPPRTPSPGDTGE